MKVKSFMSQVMLIYTWLFKGNMILKIIFKYFEIVLNLLEY